MLNFLLFSYIYQMILNHISELTSLPKKIISLVPSQTELLHYLQLENETIGITKFCIHPKEWHDNKIKIGGTKALNIEKILEMKPDLIIANKEENVKDQVEELAAHFPVWVTDVNTLEDAYLMINEIGILTGKETIANDLNEKIKSSFSNLEQENNQALRTAYLIWKNPYMTIGGDTFINDLLKKAGFKNVFENQKRYPEITVKQLQDSKCELILLSSEPYPFQEKHIHELKLALPHCKIILADGEMFSWYGSRLLQSSNYFKNLQIFADN